MSLHQIAQDVQSRGRGEDSVLIHMTPKEVQGLQALAMAGGGSLTINPDTGLPEAGFLSSLLPTLIGAGLSIASGGTINPLMAAGLVGGGTALATGNLQKGLMAGLGAYGGAGLGAGLAGAGAASIAPGAAVTDVAALQAPSYALQAPVGGLTPTAAASPYSIAPQSMYDIAAPGVSLGTKPSVALGEFVSPQTVTQMPTATKELFQPTAYGNLPFTERVSSGFKALGTEAGRDAALQGMGGGKKALQYGLAALAPSAMGMQSEYRKPEEEAPYLYQFNREQQTPTRQGPYTSAQQYFTAPTLTRIPGYAEGGMTGASKEAFDYLMGRSDVSPARAAAQTRMASMPAQAPIAPAAATTAVQGDEAPMFNFDPRTGGLVQIARPEPTPVLDADRSPYYYEGYAKGGMAKGGFVVPADVVSMLGEGSTDAGIRALQSKYGPAVKAIKGPGTGQSDSIKTTIEGKQPALVADGEVYIPPAVISKHGGAKKFYSMLDNVRTASQGHTKQQRRVNPARVMA